MPAARLPARPPARRGRIHAARSLASAVASFAASAALLLLDAGAELDEEAGAGVRRCFDAQASVEWVGRACGGGGGRAPLLRCAGRPLVWAGLGWAIYVV